MNRSESSPAAEQIVAWIRGRVPAAAHLRIDSREVAPGDVFIALPGRRSHGRAHIADAIARGAAAVLLEGSDAGAVEAAVPVLPVRDLAARLAQVGAGFYGDPTARLTAIGVTGTNGKTSCSHWIAQVLSACGQPCAVIGTVGCGFPGALQVESALTTPDAVGLQRLARRMLDGGARALAMEVSSIGLDQGRVDAVRFGLALFTNLTRDHLDYHGSMAAYERAKSRLFEWPRLRHAVLNLDDECGRRLALHCAARGIRTTGYRIESGAAQVAVDCEIGADSIDLTGQGLAFLAQVRAPDGPIRSVPVRTPVIGRFNLANVLGVLGIALACGVDAQAATQALAGLRAPPGRMQRVLHENPGPLVLVDYAHTPDAIEQALGALRPLAAARGGRLWIVFGAGGDRDAGKRPLMGAAAARAADRIVVTSDNPRGEDPERIIDQIVHGAGGPSARLAVRPERADAIGHALREADERDIVLIAGKGHETYQEIAGRRLAFSDQDCARDFLRQRIAAVPAAPGPS